MNPTASTVHREPARHDRLDPRHHPDRCPSPWVRSSKVQFVALPGSCSHHRVNWSWPQICRCSQVEAVLLSRSSQSLNNARECSSETTIHIQAWRNADNVCLTVWTKEAESGGHLEQFSISSIGAENRPGPRGYRARTSQSTRFRGSHARHHCGGEPHRSDWRDVHDQSADPAPRATLGRRRMSAAPVRVLVVDDEPPIASFCAWASRRRAMMSSKLPTARSRSICCTRRPT